MFIILLRSSPATTFFYIFVAIAYIVIRIVIKGNKQNNQPMKKTPPRNPVFPQQPQQPYTPPVQNFQQNDQQQPFAQKDEIQQFMDFRTPPASSSNMTSTGSYAVYCVYCGKRFSNVQALQRDTCFKHPKSELGLQKHVLYQGPGKPNIAFG